VWQSADPVLGKYLPSGGAPNQLPGMGGAYNSFNLGVYSYGHLNPIRYSDPDGNATLSTGLSADINVFAKKIFRLPVEGAVGGSIGVAISIPSSPRDPTKLDVGVYITERGEGGASIGSASKVAKEAKGIGKLSVDITVSKGSVTNMEGVSTDRSVTVGPIGAHWSPDREGEGLESGGIHTGAGLEISTSTAKTEVYSARRGIERAVSAGADAAGKAIKEGIRNLADRILSPPRPQVSE